MAAKRGIRKIAGQASRELVVEVLRGFLLPIVIAVLGAIGTMLSGLASPVPLPYLFVASALVFGAIAWAGLNVHILRDRLRAADKLAFESVWFGRDLELENGVPRLRVAQLGFHLKNLAAFPMRYRIVEIRTSFEGRINNDPKYKTRGGRVPAGSVNLFRDASIDLGDGLLLRPDQIARGKLFVKVEYDRTEDYRYSLVQDVDCEVRAGRAGELATPFSWSYSGREGDVE